MSYFHFAMQPVCLQSLLCWPEWVQIESVPLHKRVNNNSVNSSSNQSSVGSSRQLAFGQLATLEVVVVSLIFKSAQHQEV